MTPTADQIRAMIADRDRLEAALRKADTDIMAMGRAFWNAQGLCAFPRVDALRRAVAK